MATLFGHKLGFNEIQKMLLNRVLFKSQLIDANIIAYKNKAKNVLER